MVRLKSEKTDSLVEICTTGKSEHHERSSLCALETKVGVNGGTVLEPFFPEWVKVGSTVILLWPVHTESRSMSDDLISVLHEAPQDMALTSWLEKTQVVLDLVVLVSSIASLIVCLSLSASHSQTSKSKENVWPSPSAEAYNLLCSGATQASATALRSVPPHTRKMKLTSKAGRTR